eukprot:4055250-Pyramimonas_sp.AAC.1
MATDAGDDGGGSNPARLAWYGFIFRTDDGAESHVNYSRKNIPTQPWWVGGGSESFCRKEQLC